MKKLALIFSLALVLTGCSLTKLSVVDYNNRIVSQVNEASIALESTATIYNATIPEIVTEKTEINADEMQKSYRDAISIFNMVTPLSRLSSNDFEQELAVKAELSRYETAGTIYLNEFEGMLAYYSDGTYQEDISRVGEIDNNLHTAYLSFIDSNNALVALLGTFVDTE